MLRALFGKSTSVITPEEYKAVEDQLNSKVRLLEETSRQLEQSKRQCREVNEKLKVSQQKQGAMTTEIASLKEQLRMAKESTGGNKLLPSSTPVGKSEDGKSDQAQTAMINSLKKQIAQLTTENKQLIASTQPPKNHNSKNDSTTTDVSTTSKTNDAKSIQDNNKELWEQLKDVLVRPSTLVD